MILFLSIKESIITISVTDKYRIIFKNNIFSKNENLVVLVDKLLKHNRIRPKNLKAVVVGDAVGGFTASRSMVAFANTLSFALNIKVARIKNLSIESKDFIKNVHKALKLRNSEHLIRPKYSGPVSVTFSNKK